MSDEEFLQWASEIAPNFVQHARELAPECTSEEFAEIFGVASVCNRCGRKGLDEEHYTDCDLVPNDNDPDGPWDLLCNDCIIRLQVAHTSDGPQR